MSKIDITIEEYDKDNVIVFVESQGKNIWFTLGIMQFEDDMEHWDKPTYTKEVAGRKGFVFSRKIDTKLLLLEIRGFITQFKLEEMDFSKEPQ